MKKKTVAHLSPVTIAKSLFLPAHEKSFKGTYHTDDKQRLRLACT